MTQIPDAAWLRRALLANLPRATSEAVSALLDAAAPAAVYAVGGAVRDVIIGRNVQDIDLAVECDAIELVQRAFPAVRITAHSRFRTASFMAGGRRVDVVTARSEEYARPGALPRVSAASIEDDLRRRDFSINALALRLSGDPALLDPCGGLADIQSKRIRVLHDASFLDDPTRVFRACRYSARLGFSIETHTRALAGEAASGIAHLSSARARRELQLILCDDGVGDALQACEQLGALSALHAALSCTDDDTGALGLATVHEVNRVPVGFAFLAAHADVAAAETVIERLRLRREEAAAVRGIAALRGASGLLSRDNARPSGVVLVLDRYPLASVIAFAATTDDPIAASLALRYLDDWRSVTPSLRGDDVISLGVPEGPNVQKALQLVRAARLDGTARDLADERALVLRFARSIHDAGIMTGDIELHSNGH